MNIRIAILILPLLFCGCASMAPAHDSWTGRDKFHHFWVSGTIAGAATAVVNYQEEDVTDGFPIVMGVTLSFGVAKEAYDQCKPGGHWSWKDLVWDVAGALAGYSVVEALE